jgi:glycosyltransferase involved in cell wall biosynthesis
MRNYWADFLKLSVTLSVFMMKVLFLSIYDPLSFGGPENHIKYLSQELCNLGCEVHILICGSKTMDKNINGINLHFVKPYLFRSIFQGFTFSLFSFKIINKLCKQYNVDVVHSHSPSGFGYALLSKERPPFVVTLHGTSFGEIASYFNFSFSSINFSNIRDAMFTQPMTAFLTNLEYKFADKVIAVSEAIASEASRFYHLPIDKIEVIPNGVNLSYPPNENRNEVEKDDHTILFVGRLIWRKGVKFLIDAMPQILAEYPKSKLFLVGDGMQRGSLERGVKELRIENSVLFLGKVSNETLFSLYQKADVYVQPSLYEPFGISILEAMSWGKPIVGTYTGGTPELIKNGNEGILVEPGNSLQLAKAVLDILPNSMFRKKLGENARRKVLREFTWKSIAQKTLRLYEEMLELKSTNNS